MRDERFLVFRENLESRGAWTLNLDFGPGPGSGSAPGLDTLNVKVACVLGPGMLALVLMVSGEDSTAIVSNPWHTKRRSVGFADRQKCASTSRVGTVNAAWWARGPDDAAPCVDAGGRQTRGQ